MNETLKHIIEHIYNLTNCGQDLICEGMTDDGRKEILRDVLRHTEAIGILVEEWYKKQAAPKRATLILLPPLDDEDLTG